MTPGEALGDWWTRSGRPSSGIDDYELYLHDVPHELAERVLAHDGALAEKTSMGRAGREPWSLAAGPTFRRSTCTAAVTASFLPTSYAAT
ncbi:hypothetical protein [Nonomuraea sp. NPDC048901]|uniref:hypothetical protein n=1 Tax=Nonomuraea sp. NPDC048901 TaxID=3155627 RepID=UPI003401A935